MKRNGKARMYPVKSKTDCKGAGVVTTQGYANPSEGYDGTDGVYALVKAMAKKGAIKPSNKKAKNRK